MTSLSPNNRLSSPGSSNDDQELNQTPPPLEMPPEIRIFQQQNCSDKGLNNNSVSEQNYQTDYNQVPTQNSKMSFCIDALLAKNQAGDESDLEKRSFTQFVNNNYKDSVISRDLNNSPDDQISRWVDKLSVWSWFDNFPSSDLILLFHPTVRVHPSAPVVKTNKFTKISLQTNHSSVQSHPICATQTSLHTSITCTSHNFSFQTTQRFIDPMEAESRCQ